MRRTTKFAIAAMATALMGSTAIAADLGGNCCADLEERIAELEATTVRKGTRKVSLTISGFVSHHVMVWDDGIRGDTYIGDGGNYGSRWRFVGQAKISPELTAGFTYEFQHTANAIGGLNQEHQADNQANGDDLGATCPQYRTGGSNLACFGQRNSAGATVLRDSTVWLRHQRLGMVKVGHGSTATDNLILIDLGGTTGAATPDVALYNGGFRLANEGLPTYSSVTWASVLNGGTTFDTGRANHVLYETPSLHGFTVQAAYGEDNFWDVALRYAGEFNGVRVAFGIGYSEDSEWNQRAAGQNAFTGNDVLCARDCTRNDKTFMGSASVLHVPTGLFLTGAWGTREREFSGAEALVVTNARDVDFWYLAGGVSRNFFGYGKTVLYGEYYSASDMLTQATTTFASSDATVWGLGVNQYIDAASMEIFLAYKNYSAEATDLQGAKVNFQDFSTVILGTRISF